MDFRHPWTCCSVSRVERRNSVYDARSPGGHFDDKLYVGRNLWYVFSRRSRMVAGCQVHAHLECRSDRAESGGEHGAVALRIWQILRKKVAFWRGRRQRPVLAENTKLMSMR